MLERYLAAAALALVLVAVSPPARAQDDAYTVADVHVDVTAANATAARDNAVAQGQQRAYEMLMTKLGAGKAPRIGTAALNDLVTGFEVANERRSGVRYVADYTVHFNPEAVKKLLQGAAANDTGGNNPPPVVAAKPVLILPVLKTGDRGVLWDDPNPWRSIWAGRAGTAGGVSIVVPAGDLPDVHAIDAEAAIRGDAGAIQAISTRYQNDDVLVVQGIFATDPRRIDITATLYPASGGGDARTIALSETAKPGEGDGEIMRRAAADTMRQLIRMVAASAPPPVSGGGTGGTGGDGGPVLTARLKSGSLADWVAVRERLKTIPTVKSSDLITADRGEMRVAIHYVGDEAKLKAALHSHDLDLAGSESDWSLERRGSLLPKPPEAPAPTPAPSDSAAPAAAPDPLRRADDRP